VGSPGGRHVCPVCEGWPVWCVNIHGDVMVYLHELAGGPCPGIYRRAVWVPEVSRFQDRQDSDTTMTPNRE
jgi:hypothetical protein